jgi:hypothetical protein
MMPMESPRIRTTNSPECHLGIKLQILCTLHVFQISALNGIFPSKCSAFLLSMFLCVCPAHGKWLRFTVLDNLTTRWNYNETLTLNVPVRFRALFFHIFSVFSCLYGNSQKRRADKFTRVTRLAPTWIWIDSSQLITGVQPTGWLGIDSREAWRLRTHHNRSFYHTRWRNTDWLTSQVITEWMTFTLPGDNSVCR